MSKTGKHLMVHQGALGDFVLALRLAERLTGEVTVATTGSRVGFLRRFEGEGWGIKGVEIEQRGFAAMFGEGDVEEGFKGFCEGFDGVVVSFVSDGKDRWAEKAGRVFGRAKVVYVKPRPEVRDAGHVTKWQAGQLEAQAREWVVEGRRFGGVWRGEKAAGVVIHPGSGGAGKRWPLERFAALSRRLVERGAEVRWAVSPDDLEMDKNEALAGCLREFNGVVVESLVNLAEMCLGAGVWVGNDSGPSHLAGFLGVPTVALFGATDARVWAPVGERVRVVESKGGGMEGLEVGEVEGFMNYELGS